VNWQAANTAISTPSQPTAPVELALDDRIIELLIATSLQRSGWQKKAMTGLYSLIS